MNSPYELFETKNILPPALSYYVTIIFTLQVVGFILLWVNTSKMEKDHNARGYYNLNVASSVLVALPLISSILTLIYLYFLTKRV